METFENLPAQPKAPRVTYAWWWPWKVGLIDSTSDLRDRLFNFRVMRDTARWSDVAGATRRMNATSCTTGTAITERRRSGDLALIDSTSGLRDRLAAGWSATVGFTVRLDAAHWPAVTAVTERRRECHNRAKTSSWEVTSLVHTKWGSSLGGSFGDLAFFDNGFLLLALLTTG